jgi:ketosteroid isomerase-like protein
VDATGEEQPSRQALVERVIAFTDAFNREDLDAVMGFFAPDALYVTFEGRHCRGLAQVRAAFEPQFRRAYGRIRFLTDDLVVDADAGKVVLSWRCQHELAELPGPRQWLYRLAYGKHFGWNGVDVLHWEAGRVKEKRTYARTGLPRVTRGGLSF